MMATRTMLASLGLVILGFAGGYPLRDTWTGFWLYHVGGLGALGLLASAAGAIAGRKGYGFWRAYVLALSLPILAGVIAAYCVPPKGDGARPAACGGAISLIAALVVVILCTFVRRREEVKR